MTKIVDEELEEVARRNGKRLHELLFDFSDVTRRHGKGRSEALLLDRAVETLPKNCVFHKITGRLFVDNHATLFAQPDPVVFSPHRSKRFRVDTRFWRATREYYDRVLRPLTAGIEDADEKRFIENSYPLLGTSRWEAPPRIVGYSGTHNTRYV
jgi:hypothetical protein